jgi:hypothetical protein
MYIPIKQQKPPEVSYEDYCGLQKQLFEKNKELYKLKYHFNEVVEEDRKRVDKLLENLEKQFNDDLKQLQEVGAMIELESKPIQCKIYDEHSPMKMTILDFGEVRIEPIHIRFIKGEKFDV